MSKDASELSLENTWSAIKPHVERLPFRRLGDYIQHVSPGRSKQIGFVDYHFKLWAKYSDIPGDAKIEAKAHSFTLGQEITYYPSDTKRLKAPMRVLFKDLVLVCPTNDMCRWLFQVSKFSPDYSLSPEGYYHNGTSKLVWIEDKNFTRRVVPYKGFSADLWNQIHEWVQGSMDERIKINKMLEELKEFSVREILKFAKA